VDFGCGTGELLKRLSKLGFTGVGIDISPGMIDCAREKLGRNKFELVTGDICNVRLHRKFPLATCFFDTLNHLTTKIEVRRCVKNIRNHLEEKGLFVFDFLTPEGLDDWNGIEVTSKDNHFILQKGKHHIRKGRAHIVIEGFIKNDNGCYDRFYQEIIERSIKIDEMAEHLRRAGFENMSFRGYHYDDELEKGGRILGIAW
jgi:SAM-dependent methyltransferase